MLQVDKGLAPLANSNNEQWCMGLDGLDKRSAEYYKAGARFAKWRSVVSIPAGPTTIAVRDCAYGLARYAAISQAAGEQAHWLSHQQQSSTGEYNADASWLQPV
jgi:fructose-bisphosphate aldolase class I